MKRLILLSLFFINAWNATACDVCGCAVGNYYFGMMPQFHKNMLGLRYRYSTFNSHLGHLESAMMRSREAFQTAEIWGRFYPHKKVQIMTFIPVSFNQQTDDQGITKKLYGLNDIVLTTAYNVVNTSMAPAEQVKHNLWLGGGLKLPTGKFNYDANNQSHVANPNFQLGSGSVDFLINANYTLRYKRIGFSTDAAFKINTANKNRYQFGDRISGNLSFFYVQKIKSVGLMPYLGAYSEYSLADRHFGHAIAKTGGALLSATVGLEFYYKWLAVGVNYQQPVAQNLAGGNIHANGRLVAHISFLF